MFLKTLKHDLKNSYKDYMMLYLTMLVFAVLAPLGARSNIDLLNVVVAIMFMFIIFGSIVLMISNTIKFIKRRLFDEGAYFNLTLPVSIDTTIFSKILSVTIWVYVTTLFIILSIVILALTFVNFDLELFRQVQQIVSELLRNINWLQVVFALIFQLIGSFVFAAMLILVMTVVNTSWFSKTNYFISLLLFIVLITAFDWLDGLFNIVAIGRSEIIHIGNLTGELVTVFTLFEDPLTAIVYILYELIIFGVLFMGIRTLFKKKLEI